MDTHVSSNPALDGDMGPGLRARLPGEPEAELAAQPGTAPPRAESRPVSSSPPRRRRWLLAGVAAVALLTAAGSAFVVSPYNHVVPVPRRVIATVQGLEAQAGIGFERPLAPSASLAGVKLPSVPRAVVAPKYTAQSPAAELSELMQLHGGGDHPVASAPAQQAPPAATAPPASPESAAASSPSPPSGKLRAVSPSPGGPPPGYVPHEPGVAAHMPAEPAVASVPVTQPPAAAPSPPRAIRAESASSVSRPPPAVSPSPARPVASQAREASVSAPAFASTRGSGAPSKVALGGPLKPAATEAPVKSASPVVPARDVLLVSRDLQQTQILDLVTQMGTMLRDERNEVAQLRADVARTNAATGERLADFGRRLAFVEARDAVAGAVAAGKPPSPAPTPAATDKTAPVVVSKAEAVLPAAQVGDRKGYRLQAASPGLALLAEIGRGGGTGAQIQVQVGDTLPGYGRVESIAQHGTAWVVTTENGTIE